MASQFGTSNDGEDSSEMIASVTKEKKNIDPPSHVWWKFIGRAMENVRDDTMRSGRTT